MACPRPHKHEEVGGEIRTWVSLTQRSCGLHPGTPTQGRAQRPASALPLIVTAEASLGSAPYPSQGRLPNPRAQPLKHEGIRSRHQDGGLEALFTPSSDRRRPVTLRGWGQAESKRVTPHSDSLVVITAHQGPPFPRAQPCCQHCGGAGGPP